MAQVAESFKQKCAYEPTRMVGALVDSIPYPLIVRDPDGNIVLANQSAEEQYGGELLGCKCHERVQLRECFNGACPAREAQATGKPVEREVQHPETERYLVLGAYPMYDRDGEFCGIIETVRDVTEHHRSIERVRALLERVERQNRELTEWRDSFEYELRAAREVQLMLVPGRPMCAARMCFDFLYRPSGEVGGDLYDVIAPDGQHACLLVSDASGHGVGAALVATMLKVVFRSPSLDRLSPADVLRGLNNVLLELSPIGQFATAFYCVYHADSQELHYANAGHPAPLLLRQGASQPEQLDAEGMILGVLPGLEVAEEVVPFRPGDRMLVYTDGVPDATNEDGDRFGLDRLMAAAAAARSYHGRIYLQGVVNEVEMFLRHARAADDITMVLAEAVSDERQEQLWQQGLSHP